MLHWHTFFGVSVSSLGRCHGLSTGNTSGRGGQKFIERCVPKVSELRARFPEKDIEVDGGVGPSTIGVCAEAGTSLFHLHLLQPLVTLGNIANETAHLHRFYILPMNLGHSVRSLALVAYDLRYCGRWLCPIVAPLGIPLHSDLGLQAATLS